MSTENLEEVRAIADNLVEHLQACLDRGGYDGHDQMTTRQLALCVILRARPRGPSPAQSIHALVPLLDNDWRMMVARFEARGEGLQA